MSSSLHARSMRSSASRNSSCGETSSTHPVVASPRVACRRRSTTSCASTSSQEAAPASTRRQLLAGFSSGLMLLASGGAKAQPFLSSTGAKGILAEEEEYLFQLRVEKEGEARRELDAERTKLETEVRESQGGKLCATPFGVDVVGIFEFVCLVGALVGGVSARQRKNEVEKLNEQLRSINLSLRQQARAGTVYAPGLSYAPSMPSFDSPASSSSAVALKLPPAANVLPSPITPSGASATALPPSSVSQLQSTGSVTMMSIDEDAMNPDQLHCRDALRAGKRLLKEQNGAAAMVRFEKALMLSKALNDQIQERRAVRGLAASARLQGQHRTAIKNLQRVLEISKVLGDYTGDADAYGTIADCYTDMGDFDQAAVFYDKYIDIMNRDGPV